MLKKFCKNFVKKRTNSVHNILRNNPQRKGFVSKVFTCSPKKPNSAKRKVVRVRLTTGKYIICALRGKGHTLQEHSVVLIRGGRMQDVPGVRFTLVRGKYDLKGVLGRKTARSKYGTKN